MTGLRALLLRHEPSNAGRQAIILLIEPNDFSHEIRCLCRYNGLTELAEFVDDGYAWRIPHLHATYGGEAVVSVSRRATLGYDGDG